ncbi:MAG: hypothetical protein U0457_18725 [Candidatus Sericytochromatia bacterium]
MKQTVKIALSASVLASMLALQACPPGQPAKSPDVTQSSAAPSVTPSDSSSVTPSTAPSTGSSTAPSTAPSTGSSTAPTAAPVSPTPAGTPVPAATTSYIVPITMDSGTATAYVRNDNGAADVIVNFDNVDPTPTQVDVIDGFGNTVGSSTSFNISGVTGSLRARFLLNGLDITKLSIRVRTSSNTKVFTGKVDSTKTGNTPAAKSPTGTPVATSSTSSSGGSSSGGGNNGSSSNTSGAQGGSN